MKKVFFILILVSTLSSFARAQWLDTNVVHIRDTTEFDIWERQMNFDVEAIGFKFKRVVVYNVWQNETVIGVDIFYSAPSAQPTRIQCKVKFSDGLWIRTDIFPNLSGGEQKFTYFFDTKDFGAWGLKPHLPMFFWVETCQSGPGCVPSVPGLLDETNPDGNTKPDIKIHKKDDLEK